MALWGVTKAADQQVGGGGEKLAKQLISGGGWTGGKQLIIGWGEAVEAADQQLSGEARKGADWWRRGSSCSSAGGGGEGGRGFRSGLMETIIM